MVKVCKKDFPKGSYKGQQSDGFYMDEYLMENLDVIAEKVADDQMFVILITGSGHVRVGKSVFAHQIAYYLTHKVNELHKVKNTYTIKNVVFKGEELQERAFSFPKYSVISLDEGDDLVEHYWSKMAKDLRRFFRKAGQLNHFVILVLPDFFELPRSFAITRSMFLLNVKFKGRFDRGYFEFYNFEKKKQLYLKGKKNANYSAEDPNFIGRFVNMYPIDEKEYREKKHDDLMKADAEEEQKTPLQITLETRNNLLLKLYESGIPINKLIESFELSKTMVYDIIKSKNNK